MHTQGLSQTSVFRPTFLVAIAGLMLSATTTFAQNATPSTAPQAAKMPEFASLPHPSRRQLPTGRPGFQGAPSHRSPADANIIYENGPTDGQTYAWGINFGGTVSDTFTITQNAAQISGMNFGAWLYPGDVLQSVEVSISSQPLKGGTSYFDQIINLTQSGCVPNNSGFTVCTEAGSFTVSGLNAGTYWVNLQNAVVNTGDPVYWDQNSGVGCHSQGCPSQAEESSVGTIPSEAFTVLGTSSPPPPTNNRACPAPQTGFHDIHDFGTGPIGYGVTIDQAGDVYGTIPTAGIYAQGLLYRLTQRAGHWFDSTLYNFLGGSNGANPYGVIVGQHGELYGSAAGGSYGYGLIYKATPPLHTCANTFCGWNESAIYEFKSSSDAFGVTTFDSAGNLYGITCCGGLYGSGAVFELMPSQGSWTEKLLYTFTGGKDGGSPNGLLVGRDGNLYGTASVGGNTDCGVWGDQQCGVVFELTPSGSGWTERVIYAFTGSAGDGYQPHSLIQDGQGNLLGISTCQYEAGECWNGGVHLGGVVFLLSPAGDGWDFNQYHYYIDTECPDFQYDVTYHALAMDGSGNLYATEGGSEIDGNGNQWWCGAVLNVIGGGGTTLVSGNADVFGNLTSDADGNLYGTTSTCGFGTTSRTTGMVWRYSP